jgi:hypothetical protein
LWGILSINNYHNTMNKAEALEFDKRYKMLPGGQGEHEFWVAGGYKRVSADLCNFAEHCGGYFGGIGAGLRARLETCDCGTFMITVSPDKSRVTTIEKWCSPQRIVLYWDERRERHRDGDYYQTSNAHKPFLSDWELTDDELAADQARIAREKAETPPPPPPRINHDKIFRDGLSLSAEEVRCPYLRFEIHETATAFDHSQNPLLHNEVTTLRRIKGIADREYFNRSCYIFMPRANHPEEDGPQMGDAILRVRQPGQYMHNYSGIVTGSWTGKGKGDELQSACFNPSPFWNPLEALHGYGNPECSGGPWDRIVQENCKLVGTRLQRFWYWGDGYAGASCGVDYYMDVNLWHWVD